jgi:SulP family sulfate permease
MSSLTPPDRSRRLLDELAGQPPGTAPIVLAGAPRGSRPPQAPLLRRLAADLFAGLIVGLVTLTFSVSCAALVFSGPLAPSLPVAIASAVISASVTALVVAWRSSLRHAIAGPDSHGSALLAVMAAGIVGAVADPERAAPTVMAAVVLSSLFTGLFLYTLGRLRVGHAVRFIPFPVVGGFLAGAGWLIAVGSFKVMTDQVMHGQPLGADNLGRLIEPGVLACWLPGAILAVVLRLAQRRTQHFLVLPGLILGAVGLFHLIWWLARDLWPRQESAAWFLSPLSVGQLRDTLSADVLSRVDLPALLRQGPNLASLLLVVLIALLLNATGIEIATHSECDLNRELKANGLANLLAGVCGGMIGYLSLSRSLLSSKAHAAGRLAGAVAGLFCAAVLLLGGSFIAVFPRPVVGGLLLSLGLALLAEWLYAAWFRLSHLDYAMVVVILGVIAIWGFLPGVGAGIVIACLVFVYTYGRQRVIKHSFTGATHHSNVNRPAPQRRFLDEQGERTYILALQGYIFFGSASTLLDRVRRRLTGPEAARPRFLVLDFRLVTGLDSSAVLAFVKMRQLAARHNACRVFTALHPAIEQQLRAGGGLEDDTSPCQVFADLDRGVEWCENQLLEAGWSRRRKSVPLVLQLSELFPDPSHSAAFMGYLERLALNAGQALYRQGEKPDAMYFIESGQVTVLLGSEGQWSLRLRTLNAGTTVGERSFFTGRPHGTSARAEEPTVLYRLSTDAFERMCREAPQTAMVFQEYIIRLLADYLSHAYAELQVLFADGPSP